MNTESNNYDGWWTRDQGKDILTKRDLNLIKSNKKKRVWNTQGKKATHKTMGKTYNIGLYC